MAGADIREVSDFLGHSSVGVTADYLKRRIAAEQLCEVMEGGGGGYGGGGSGAGLSSNGTSRR